jgi:hypothetical protein
MQRLWRSSARSMPHAQKPFTVIRSKRWDVPQLQKAQFSVLGREVPDITTAVKQLAAAGIAFSRFRGMSQDAGGVWISPGGARIAWFPDPDGNTLSLTRFCLTRF